MPALWSCQYLPLNGWPDRNVTHPRNPGYLNCSSALHISFSPVERMLLIKKALCPDSRLWMLLKRPAGKCFKPNTVFKRSESIKTGSKQWRLEKERGIWTTFFINPQLRSNTLLSRISQTSEKINHWMHVRKPFSCRLESLLHVLYLMVGIVPWAQTCIACIARNLVGCLKCIQPVTHIFKTMQSQFLMMGSPLCCCAFADLRRRAILQSVFLMDGGSLG